MKIPIFPGRSKNGQEKLSKIHSAGKDKKFKKSHFLKKWFCDHYALIFVFQ